MVDQSHICWVGTSIAVNWSPGPLNAKLNKEPS